MYFNDDNKNTNIDEEFGEDFTSVAIKTINKYKLIFIGAIVLEILILIMIYFGSNNTTNYLILTGDDTINIYKGTGYIDLGYEAYNSDGENLNDYVTVKHSLNTNKVGEYEILYKLGDLVKVRKINVVEKPDNFTYIYLNKVDEQVNINLKVGQVYNEPGYEIYGPDKSLIEKVKVIGNVDTSKKGTYTLTYTVVDMNNVTISTTRTVIVE